MTAYLNPLSDTRGERIPCNNVITLGRDKNNDVILADLLVSRNHAMVRRLGEDDYYLIDSGSSNGTLVNGLRVSGPTQLRNGDRITIGRTEFAFEQDAHLANFTDSISFQQTVIFHSPVIREITVLVADIRDFTSLSEQVPIQTLTRVMSTWFHDVTAIIQKNGGIVDKFIGDCVFARWDDETGNNVVRALSTALQVAEATAKLKLAVKELPRPLRIGVGINTGMASLGIGADNTAMGDAVNTAFRLESVTKELGRDIALSESSYRHLPRRYWEGAEQLLTLKGKKEPVRAFCTDFSAVETLLRELAEG